MSEALSAAAAALGLPEALVERSAAARATETGMTVDAVLAAWAGGGQLDAVIAPSTAPAQGAPSTTADPESTPVVSVPVATTSIPAVTASVAQTRKQVPSEVGPSEAAHLPEVITVPTAGIRERTNFRIPRWLLAVMLIIPAFALFTMGGSATGECGTATELATNVVTGQIVNCDGSEFTGSGVAGGTTDYLAEGETIYVATCAGCHGAAGGGGAGPALNGVLNTFGSCADHAHWVQVGSGGFQAAGETTYGDTNKQIKGGMPPHPGLSDEQLASVVSFERVRFGGAEVEQTFTDCGLAEAAPPADGVSTTLAPGS